MSSNEPNPSPISDPPTGTAAAVLPGAVLAGKYRVARILGQGGMGVVVEARHIALDERVALKFLLPEYASHPEASGRFLREARAAVKIKSQHVARVSDVGQLEGGEPYMVMEYLDGSDLSNLLTSKGPFALADAVDYTIQACEAIAEAHSYGIVHRDLKPANLFLTRHTDGAPLVKVLDFGISKVMGGGVEALTRTTAAMGSALYMSPEQMQQTRSVDHRTDIYALGVALYEMLAGKQPYFADTLPQLCAEILTGTPTPLRSLRPDLPEAFAATLERAYARDRSARYQSVAELVVALAPFAPARSQSSIERVCRMSGLNPPQAGGAGGPAGAGTQVLPNNMPSNAAHDSSQIIPGPYSAPSSQNAVAAFATGRTNTNLSSTGGTAAVPVASANPMIFVGVAIGLVAVGGIVAAVALRGPKPTTAPPAETSAPVATTTGEPSNAAAPSGAPSAAAAAQPTDSATPAPPGTDAAGAGTSSATAPAKTAVGGRPPPTKKPTATPSAAPPPPATGKKPSVLDDR